MNRFHTVLGFILLASTFACSAGVDPSSEDDTTSLDSNEQDVKSGKSDVPGLAATPVHSVPRTSDADDTRTKIGNETKPELTRPVLQRIPVEGDGVAFEPQSNTNARHNAFVADDVARLLDGGAPAPEAIGTGDVNSPDPAPESF